MNEPITKLDDEQPIAHHYVMVLVVEAVTVFALWLLSRAFL
ncbi:MAG TPA: hypothetical protein VFZ31_06135 [Vicinamibacterales bacterium]